MPHSNYRYFSLALMAILTISACSTIPAFSGTPVSATSTKSAADTTQTADQLSQIQIQLANLQTQIDGLQNQMNDIRQQQTTLSRYINVHIPASEVIATSDPAANDNISEARHLYNAGLYAQSIRLLKNADSGGNGSAPAQERMWLLLQSHARLNNCESVINIGKRFTNLFPQNNHSPNALYQVAQCQAHLQQQDIARTTYQHIISTYPNSSAASKARHLLKK
ncbi:tetratricopeptide repeat protein [Snodgrassella gandavensis]|uniref:tetratricopeptide repeat protein n=1 Tax=Snodgrassella gandavensis TaxID=2946698 RepID=UPI001EF59B28|nr:tetratricopeptide repeat protein [Snodgrassella gandavensis]